MDNLIVKTSRLIDCEEVILINVMLKEYRTTQNNDLLVEIMKLPFIDSIKFD